MAYSTSIQMVKTMLNDHGAHISNAKPARCSPIFSTGQIVPHVELGSIQKVFPLDHQAVIS